MRVPVKENDTLLFITLNKKINLIESGFMFIIDFRNPKQLD